MKQTEIESHINSLEREAVASGRTPRQAAAYAAQATLAAARRRRGQVTGRSLAAYFSAVARRRTLRCHRTSDEAARLVAEAVVADFMSSGRSGPEAYEELARGWTGKLPAEMIDDYRVRLCA